MKNFNGILLLYDKENRIGKRINKTYDSKIKREFAVMSAIFFFIFWYILNLQNDMLLTLLESFIISYIVYIVTFRHISPNPVRFPLYYFLYKNYARYRLKIEAPVPIDKIYRKIKKFCLKIVMYYMLSISLVCVLMLTNKYNELDMLFLHVIFAITFFFWIIDWDWFFTDEIMMG